MALTSLDDPKARVSELIKRGWLRLRMADRLAHHCVEGVISVACVAAEVARAAVEIQGSTATGDDASFKTVLADLATLSGDDAKRVEKLLTGAAGKLDVDLHADTTEELAVLEEIARAALSKAASESEFSAALAPIRLAEAVCAEASSISISDPELLSDWMVGLIRDFEHANEMRVLHSIHRDLRSGTYYPGGGE